MLSLSGRLEEVHIKGQYTPYCAIGELDGNKIHVTDGNKYVGRNCLVRFDLRQDRSTPSARFISSDTSQPSGLVPEEYVLLGVWEGDMVKSRQYPTLDEINRYYNPGDIGCGALYLRNPNNRRDGKVYVKSGMIQKVVDCSLSKTIRKTLPSPNRSSRVILAESQVDIDKVIEILSELDLKPITMERLR